MHTTDVPRLAALRASLEALYAEERSRCDLGAASGVAWLGEQLALYVSRLTAFGVQPGVPATALVTSDLFVAIEAAFAVIGAQVDASVPGAMRDPSWSGVGVALATARERPSPAAFDRIAVAIERWRATLPSS